MSGRWPRVAVGLLVAATSIGCGTSVESPRVAPRQTAAPTTTTTTTTTIALPPVTVTTAIPRPIHPAVASRPVVARVGADPGDPSTWDALARCESGGNWADNTGNGYYGGLQFSLSTWRSVGGAGLPSDATREEQIRRAQILQSRSGFGPWPACSRRLGYR